jgi:hypothetical protein
MRQVIIYTACFILMILGFVGVVYAIDYSNELKSVSWSAASCGETQITKEAAFLDSQQPVEDQQAFLPCYCFAQFKSVGPAVSDISFEDGSTLCESWYDEYIRTQAILYLVSLSITAINFILRRFARESASFEAHHDATKKLRSITTK